MERKPLAVLGIYDSCDAAEPSKEFKLYQITFNASKAALALAEKAEKVGQEEQEALMLEMLQVIFPTLTAEDMGKVSGAELKAFMDVVRNGSNKELERVEKN